MKQRQNVLMAVSLIVVLAAAGCGESAPAAFSKAQQTEEMDNAGTSAWSGLSDAAETADSEEQSEQTDTPAVSYRDLQETGHLELENAEEFQVDELGEYRRILIPEDSQTFLLIPEDRSVPEDIPDDVQILQQPLDRTYLVSTSVMDYICTIDALDKIRFSGTKEDDWTIMQAQEAMDLGYIDYAGKYSAPDYETLLAGGCNLAIENTMIYHNPEVREKLMNLGIPVIVERSSYEKNPLGRLEWIRLYGVLYGKEQEADSWYENEIEELEPVLQEENTGTTVAFFSVTSNGAVTVRKPGDYISKLIEMAGGRYILSSTEDEDNSALSTMHMQMEEFYAEAKDADILIYNSTIEGEITSIRDLLEKDALFGDFKAVQEGNIWCTGENLFQQPTGMGEFLLELHDVFTGDSGKDLQFLTKVSDG